MRLRDQLVRIAAEAEGFTSDDPEYGELIWHADDDAQMRKDMLKMSGCGLVVRGFLRRLGVDHPGLGAYRVGSALANLVRVASANGWLDTSREVDLLSPGSIMCIKPAMPHVATVVLVDGVYIYSIDGGQVDDRGRQCIKLRKRAKRDIQLIWAIQPED